MTDNFEIDSSDNIDEIEETELEAVLSDPSCDFGTLRTICKGKPVSETFRKDVWGICLDAAGAQDGYSDFDDLFDLPEQLIIRNDCQGIVDSLGNDEAGDKVSVLSELESIITCYAKMKNASYKSDNGWLPVLKVLISLKISKLDLFSFFRSLLRRYVPTNANSGADGNCYHLFRLLILYHDPELCTLLDTKKISPSMFADDWFKSLFAANCQRNVILPLWDVYFQRADPFFVFFMSLVILINAKDQLLEMIHESASTIVEKLKQFPSALDAEDIEDFCSLAQYYVSKTPHSFRKQYSSLLFESSDFEFNPNFVPDISQLLCLPVSISELMQANQLGVGTVRYFLVDCRPADQYNAGHLPTAFHLDANLMLQNSQEFNTAVEALFETQKHSIATGSEAGGQHLCFVGSGREQEDQYVFMVVAQFLQRKHEFISMANGGYKAIHALLEDNLNNGLQNHIPKLCIECNPGRKLEIDSGSDSDQLDTLMHRISGMMKEKGSKVKDKVIDYIKNDHQRVERHVSSADRTDKPYRSLGSVFTIAGDDDEDDDETLDLDDGSVEVVSLQDWLSKPDIKYKFSCQFLSRSAGPPGPAHLLVSDTHMFILKELPERDGVAAVVARRPLQHIVKITSKKRDCRIISFKHGTISDSGEKETIVAIDKVFIEDAGEATKVIKQQITKIWEDLESAGN